ncbi:hypothetical protein FB45DRAFT_886673 [Roridomyces roridus]|uniref:ACB domain-containing protein n=1 Tax=Roridomyces roridus TaxID=1738132 RepID=A0AAD7G0V1_9AGAR|nr:hypothetical protein FB45DRAFT_886673 [Roridomyces roridus]
MSETYTKAQFQAAANIVTKLPKDGPIKLGNDDKLQFYGLYKRAPGMFDFEGKAKLKAYEEMSDVTPEQAWTRYVNKLLPLLEQAGDSASIEVIKSAV